MDSYHAILTVHPIVRLMATLKPRPVYTKKTVTKKTMTEQTKPDIPTITKVNSHLPDITLIDRNDLWDDFRNRIKINNYEVMEAMKDLQTVVNKTKALYAKVTTSDK